MLAAKNIFDAQRNPAGNFPHRYEIKDAGGLRLVIDRATNLAWTRQQNLVKMNRDKSSQWIASLNNVAFAGSKNWRLPTVEEAASLLRKDDGNSFLDAIFGKDLKVIWTGDGFSDSESWVIDFQNGTADSRQEQIPPGDPDGQFQSELTSKQGSSASAFPYEASDLAVRILFSREHDVGNQGPGKIPR